jgi:hypothetical protein
MLTVFLLSACAPADLGGNEDSLGQPRSLLANCVRYGTEDELRLRYDGSGYLAFGEWSDGSLSFQERTVLDSLGRPVLTERSTPEVGLVSHVERSYLEESWKLETVREQHWDEETVSTYTGARGGYLVESDSECFRYVDLAVGLRAASEHTFCDGEELGVNHLRWRDDRLVELERSSATDVSLRLRNTFDAQGLLSSQTTEMDMDSDGVFEEILVSDYSWDCEI